MPLKYNVIEIFSSEDVRWQGKLLTEAVVQYVHGLKIAARCVVSRGVAGCFENGEIASQKVLDISYNMPLKIEIILPAPELDRVLPTIEEMVTDGIVVVEDMEIRSHRSSRRLIPRTLLVRDVMTRNPQTVPPSTPVNEIIRLLLRSPFHGVPVVDEERRVLGMVTQSDLIDRGGMPLRLGLLAQLDGDRLDAHLATLSGKTATEVMTTNVTVVNESQRMAEAVQLMLDRELKRLPVLNEQGKLTGMLSRLDVFRTICEQVPDIKHLEVHNVVVENARFVRDIIQRDALSVSPTTSVLDVVKILGAHGAQRAAVVDTVGRLRGMIFDHDLLTAFADHPVGVWDLLVSRLSLTAIGRKHRDLLKRARAQTAAELMRTEIVCVDEGAPIEEAVQIMAAEEFKRLPVLDAHGRFCGMISRDAVLRSGIST